MMTKLSDTQSILLASAARRDSGSLLPIPGTITAPAGGVAKSLTALVTRGLAEERETGASEEVHRQDGDLRFGLFITTAGKTAIGIDDAGAGDAGGKEPEVAPVAPTAAAPVVAAPPRQTKAAAVLALLQRPEGATPAELIAATGWLPHTTRAALTGLRKKGHAIERGKRGDDTCYTVAS